jgi:imidazole glycerol-phosphate synthase subunit HisF
MLRPRIIPCLLIRGKGLVKTVRFQDGKYVGDPINAVKIFNEKEVDELMVLDIDASRERRGPDYSLIQRMAAECRMPLCYGGGVSCVEEARRIIGLGVEKVAVSSAALERPELVAEIAAAVGNQSTVVVLDVRKKRIGARWEIMARNGTVGTGRCPVEFVGTLESLGAGEIVINSVDNDGAMQGYDMAVAERVRGATSLPLTIMGGAGSLSDIEKLVGQFGVIGAGAGSLFVFKGPYRAVLINYPGQPERDRIARLARGQEGTSRTER